MAKWGLLTNHAGALICIAHDPDMRLREIATVLGISERSAHTIVSELIDVGYVIKERHGRRNRYLIQKQLPLREPVGRGQTIGEILDILVKANPPADGIPREPPSAAARTGASRVTRAAFPAGVSGADTVRAARSGAWDVSDRRQHLPYQRTAELFADWLGAPISTGHWPRS